MHANHQPNERFGPCAGVGGQAPRVTADVSVLAWEVELEDLLLRVGSRFARVKPRRRMRDYVRGLLGPVARKNSWQLAEHARNATPHGLQRLLS